MELTNEKKWEMIDEVLGKKDNIVVCDSDGEGNVHAAIMSYARAGENELLFTTDPGCQKVGNLRKNSKVALVKYEVDSKPALRMFGKAEVLEGAEAKKAYKEMVDLVPEYDDFTGPEKVFIRVRIDKYIYEWYNSPDGEEYYFEYEG